MLKLRVAILLIQKQGKEETKMTKELEEYLLKIRNKFGFTGNDIEVAIKHIEYAKFPRFEYDISILKQALTPPTADEIVKEANEYFDNIVWYDEVDKIFMVGEDMLSLDICPLKIAHKITSYFMNLEE